MEVQVKFGLCNRLQTIIGFYAFNNSKELKIIWKEDSECPGNFEDVFEPIPNVSFFESKTDNCIGDFYIYPYEKYGIEKEEYIKKMRQNHKIIVPNENILRYVKTLQLENVIGIHIRRTDFLSHVKKYFKHIIPEIDNTYFTNIIKSIIDDNPEQKILICTDNRQTQEYFFKLFPKNIIFRKLIDESNNKRQTDLKEAVIDLFCLISCKKFYGTKESSFSEFVENYRNK
tara:strand:+ start:169 stop:855 length:687 start_codon:yes stop_codon:yes gene_type:complete